jgi:hypothetical protein
MPEKNPYSDQRRAPFRRIWWDVEPPADDFAGVVESVCV